MSSHSVDVMMMVHLTEANVAWLMGLRAHSNESVDSVVFRLRRHSKKLLPNRFETSSQVGHDDRVASCARATHVAEVLGTRISAPTLGRLFGNVVDLIAGIDPSVLERLELLRSHKRSYVARAKSSIHPGRPDLATWKTNSAWWVSANVGTEDVKRSLKALCRAADLNFGTDVVFPA